MPTLSGDKLDFGFGNKKTSSWTPHPELIKFYNTQAWRKLSKHNLSINKYCVICREKGLVVRATVSDHIHEISQGGARLDLKNVQSVCKTCHNRKTASNSK